MNVGRFGRLRTGSSSVGASKPYASPPLKPLFVAPSEGKKAPWDAFWGQRYACVLDPDGNQIDLFA